jgi:predicted nucleotidyltransferase
LNQPCLEAFRQRLVEHFAPEMLILLGAQARGDTRWDSDADILVVAPCEGRPLAALKAKRRA